MCMPNSDIRFVFSSLLLWIFLFKFERIQTQKIFWAYVKLLWRSDITICLKSRKFTLITGLQCREIFVENQEKSWYLIYILQSDQYKPPTFVFGTGWLPPSSSRIHSCGIVSGMRRGGIKRCFGTSVTYRACFSFMFYSIWGEKLLGYWLFGLRFSIVLIKINDSVIFSLRWH